MKSQILVLLLMPCLLSGCATHQYPDQRGAFLDSHSDQGYELFETSVEEMQMAIEDKHFSVYNRLGQIKKRVTDNKALVDYIDFLLMRSDEGLQIYTEAFDEFAGKLTDKDRVFRYSQDRVDGVEEGIVVIRDGEIVLKEVTAQQVFSVEEN
jgi:hypothetical protein